MPNDKQVVEFRALLLANKERSSYGLRYHDYNRYRKHCASRVQGLRGTLKHTHGKGREFKKLPSIPLESLTSGHLNLLLFEAERAFFFGQELMNSFASTKSNATRRRAMARFRRAIHWSDRLQEQCQGLHNLSILSKENYAQAAIYSLLIKGQVLRVQEEFQPALETLSATKVLLDELENASATSHDQAVAAVFIDTVAPEIRHCAHSLGHKRAYDIDGVVKQIDPNVFDSIFPSYSSLVLQIRNDPLSNVTAGGKKKLESLQWEGHPVAIRNPELVSAMFKVEAANKKLQASGSVPTIQPLTSRRRVAAFDDVLQSLSEAEDIARKLASSQPVSEASVSQNRGDIRFVHEYITYQLLAQRTRRDFLLIDVLIQTPVETQESHKSPKQPSEPPLDPRVFVAVVKIYDTLLQSLNQIRALSIVDESQDLASATDARIVFARAQRCFYMTKTYGTLRKYAEALSLIQTALLHTREARDHLSFLTESSSAVEPSYFPLIVSQIAETESTIRTEEAKLKLDWFDYNGGTLSGLPDPNKKPLFYDIALNSVSLPLDQLSLRAGREVHPTAKTGSSYVSQPTTIEEETGAVTQAPDEVISSSGLRNLLGSWWGRK